MKKRMTQIEKIDAIMDCLNDAIDYDTNEVDRTYFDTLLSQLDFIKDDTEEEEMEEKGFMYTFGEYDSIGVGTFYGEYTNIVEGLKKHPDYNLHSAVLDEPKEYPYLVVNKFIPNIPDEHGFYYKWGEVVETFYFTPKK